MTARTSHRESDDDYRGFVAAINDRWRIVSCRDGIQWIVQTRKWRRDGKGWQSRGYCRTREGLRLVCTRLAGPLGAHTAALLGNLPGRISQPTLEPVS